MAKRLHKKYRVLSCEKILNPTPKDIAKGLVYKVMVLDLGEVSAKSKVEVKAGTEIDASAEAGVMDDNPWSHIYQVGTFGK